MQSPPDAWLTLNSFESLPLAELARLRLRQADIPCRLLNAEVVSMDPFLGNAVGYITLQVPGDQFAAANLVLHGTAGAVPPTTRDECVRCGEPLDREAPCPMCGHLETPDDDPSDSPTVSPASPDSDEHEPFADEPFADEASPVLLLDPLRSWRKAFYWLYLGVLAFATLIAALGLFESVASWLF